MERIKEALRVKLGAQLSQQQIAAALALSKGVVTKYVGLAAAAALDWSALKDINEVALQRRLIVAPERPRVYVQPGIWPTASRIAAESICTGTSARIKDDLPDSSSGRCGRRTVPARSCSSITLTPLFA